MSLFHFDQAFVACLIILVLVVDVEDADEDVVHLEQQQELLYYGHLIHWIRVQYLLIAVHFANHKSHLIENYVFSSWLIKIIAISIFLTWMWSLLLSTGSCMIILSGIDTTAQLSICWTTR